MYRAVALVLDYRNPHQKLALDLVGIPHPLRSLRAKGFTIFGTVQCFVSVQRQTGFATRVQIKNDKNHRR